MGSRHSGTQSAPHNSQPSGPSHVPTHLPRCSPERGRRHKDMVSGHSRHHGDRGGTPSPAEPWLWLRGSGQRMFSLVPQRCGNFLQWGGAVSCRLPPAFPWRPAETSPQHSPPALHSPPHHPAQPRSPLVEVVLGVVQPQPHSHRVALPALCEDVVHGGCGRGRG